MLNMFSLGPASSCQVVKLLGSNVPLVHQELLFLLQDDALEVRGHRQHQPETCSLASKLMLGSGPISVPFTSYKFFMFSRCWMH